MEISDKELLKVEGGGVNIGVIFGIAAGVTFLISVIDGIVRPLKCH